MSGISERKNRPACDEADHFILRKSLPGEASDVRVEGLLWLRNAGIVRFRGVHPPAAESDLRAST
jgi:hypothetical protein